MTVKSAELRNLSEEELEEKLAEAKEELFNLRFQVVTGQLDNPMRIKEVRKDVARVMTILRERELEKMQAEDAAPAEAVETPVAAGKRRRTKGGEA